MSCDADAISAVVLQQFDRLPSKRKPIIRDNGLREWIPLSGIVARGGSGQPLICVALATGMKCLPASKLPAADGGVIHDWHAEVLAIRAFNHFVLEECRDMLSERRPSDFLRLRSDGEIRAQASGWHGQPFAWREDITLHMYSSEAPCGDASMELTMAAQDDASPWDVPLPAGEPGPDGSPWGGPEAALPGRAYFSRLGVVRRKPARGDAPPTLSKSCSDKIALKQCTSLLSSVTSLLVSPENAYLRTLVLPESQHSAAGCERAFSATGRMSCLVGRRWSGGYSFKPFGVTTTEREFAYSRPRNGAASGRTVASNLAVAWSRLGLDEGQIGGVLQGRKQFDPRGASLTSRRKLWGFAVEIAGLLGAGCVGIQRTLNSPAYQEVKDGELLASRKEVKVDARSKALGGWIRNHGDSAFSLGTRIQ